MKKIYILMCLLIIVGTSYAQSDSTSIVQSDKTDQTGSFGIRAGIGTDINLGLAYGGGFNYRLAKNMELGLVFFGGKSSETSDNGYNLYEETTKYFAIGAQANWLFGHRPDKIKPFFIAGTGLAFISLEWEESSETDLSLGTPLPGGGSMQSEEGGVGGLIFDIGLGLTFSSPFDLRFEVPIMIPFGIENIAVVPLFVFTAGYRFGSGS